MKSAAEYLKNHAFEARRPRRDLQPVIAYPAAVQAIEQALADAEKYKYLLMRALRHHTDDTLVGQGVSLAAPVSLASVATVLPLYSEQERMAA